MATTISGETGTVNGSGDFVKSWSAEIDVGGELLESTTMGSNGYREYIRCLKGGTGTILATTQYFGTAEPTSAPTTVALANDNNTYSGSVYFESVGVETPVDGIVMYTHPFRFHGSITVA